MKLRADSHGLYVRINGSVFRPVPSVCTPEMPLLVGAGYGPGARAVTGYKQGDDAKVLRVGGAYCVRVLLNGQEEWWSGHGSYLDSTTEACWDPRPPTVKAARLVWKDGVPSL